MIKREHCGGGSPIMVAGYVRGLISGNHVWELQVEGKTTSLHLSLEGDALNSIHEIMSQTMTNPIGQQVTLLEVATLEKVPSSIGIVPFKSAAIRAGYGLDHH